MDEGKIWKVAIGGIFIALVVGIIAGYSIRASSGSGSGSSFDPSDIPGRLSVIEAYLKDLQSDIGLLQGELGRVGEIHSQLVKIESGLREIQSGIDQQTRLGDQTVGELNDIIQRIEGGYPATD